MDELLNLITNEPPPFVSWLTTALATFLVALQIWDYWRKRGRLAFRPLVAKHYMVKMTEEHVNMWSYFTPPAVGDPLEVFTVIEFTITNRHSRTITIGRINVDGWMYETSYQRFMYDRARDYRVYDLHTYEPTSLADYGPLPPGEEAGFRIEAYEHRGNYVGDKLAKNRFWSMRARVPMELHRKMAVELHTSDGPKKFRFNLDSTTLSASRELFGVYRLSGDELLREQDVSSATTGLDVPQGVQRIYYREPRTQKLKRWYVKSRRSLRRLFKSGN